MMKKLVFGCWLAFGLVQGDCWGMDGTVAFNGDELSGLVQSVVRDPSKSDDLKRLISYLTGSINGREACEKAVDALYALNINSDSLVSEQVCAMLYAIRNDWSRFGYALSADYYIKEGFSGKFGPYFIPDDVEY